MPEPVADDPMDALRATVRATQEAAERLAHDGVPADGWASGAPAGADGFAHEVEALTALLRSLRDLLPDDLRAQVAELVRQLLLVVRSVIDVLVARMEDGAAPRARAPEVQDIPLA